MSTRTDFTIARDDLDRLTTPEDLTLDTAVWQHINRVLALCGHNISEAAERLGLQRSSLQRRLARRYGKPPRAGRFSARREASKKTARPFEA